MAALVEALHHVHQPFMLHQPGTRALSTLIHKVNIVNIKMLTMLAMCINYI
jgi:hypothetical protein